METIERFLNFSFFVAAFVFISYSSYITLNPTEGVLLFSTEIKDSTQTIELSVFNDDYTQPEGAKLYPWDFVAEPLRQTTIQITNSIDSDGFFYWIFTRLNKERKADFLYEDYGTFDSSIEIIEQGLAYLKLRFNDSGIVYEMNITQYTDSTKQEIVQTSSYEIAAKFVRREIRQMSDTDRTHFFDGLESMHRLTAEEGDELYGDNFKITRHFSIKHLDKFNNDHCSPYHGGDVFFTSHAAFSLSYERSLQSMYPELALPYWDFTLDDVLFGKNWAISPIFSEDWFSPLVSSTEEENYPIAKGRFAYTPVPIDYESASHNSYGRITTYFNNNPILFTSRSNTMCGIIVTETTLPGCTILNEAINYTSFNAFSAYVQNVYHSRLHGQLGGYWGCRHEWSVWTDSHPLWLPVLRHASQRFEIGFLAEGVNLTCPTSCEEGEVCNCECPSYTSKLKEIDDEYSQQQFAFDTVYGWGLLTAMFAGSPSTVYVSIPCVLGYDSCTMSNYFKDIPESEQQEFWPWFLELVCSPPKFSDFSSPFAASYDPLFMPSHHNLIRWWSYFRTLAQDNPAYDYSWGNDDMCWGHEYYDATGFGVADIGYFPTTVNLISDEKHSYTNQELDVIFHPFNEDLPYIFGSFNKSFCDD